MRKKKTANAKADPAANLKGMLTRLEQRSKVIEERINDCNKRLLLQKREIKKASTGKKTRAKQQLIQRNRNQAKRIIAQRKTFENQLNQLRNQEANVHNQMFQLENMEFAAEQAKAMKATKTAMKKMQLDVEDVADLKYSTEEYAEDLHEVQELLGETPGGLEFDDEDLQLELDMLDDDYVATTVPQPTGVNKRETSDDLDLEAELELLEELPDAPVNNQVRREERRAIND